MRPRAGGLGVALWGSAVGGAPPKTHPKHVKLRWRLDLPEM